MLDVQSQPGFNEIDIDKVGVCDVGYPIEVLDKRDEKQSPTPRINMYEDLPLKDDKITWFSVRSIDFESIHNNNA